MRKEQTRLASLVRGFRGRTIGVLGDFMLDEFLRGEARRISPEAPVPVLLVQKREKEDIDPGGAGNVAANIAALGGRPIPFGAIGKDETGRRLKELLRERGIPGKTLVAQAERITPRKVRIVALQHQLLRLDFEKPTEISPATEKALARSLAHWVEHLDALIISDYQKGSATTDLCRQTLTLARQRSQFSLTPSLTIRRFVGELPWSPPICTRPN
jgi:rfaE bifunctional protein kinase chain/domain